MSHLYWDTPFLSPLIAMDHKQLKRSRSNDAIDRTLKRPKPLQIQQDSPLSIASEPIIHTTTTTTTTTPIPTHVQQQQQQQHYFQQQQQQSVKSISISTRTLHQQQEEEPTNSYENINGILHNIHVERYGDPERRESWWNQREDIEMEEDNTEYNTMNSVLRQAFLTRHQYHE